MLEKGRLFVYWREYTDPQWWNDKEVEDVIHEYTKFDSMTVKECFWRDYNE